MLSLRLSAPPGAARPGLSFPLGAHEVVSGLGERSTAVNQVGRRVTSYVSDGPYRAPDRALAGAIVPEWARLDRDDATYYPVPWMLSSRGYGVLIDNDETQPFDLGAATPAPVERGRRGARARAARLRRPDAGATRCGASPPPRGASRRRRRRGRTGPGSRPASPTRCRWTEEARIMRTLRAADAPVSAAETQMHYLPCGAHRGLEAYERARARPVPRPGLAHLAYFNPHAVRVLRSRSSTGGARPGVLQRERGRRARVLTPPSSAATRPGRLHRSSRWRSSTSPRPATRGLLRRAWCARPSTRARRLDGGLRRVHAAAGARRPTARRRAQMHNRYPRDYHCAVHADRARGCAPPIVRFQRSGWTGAARCADDRLGRRPDDRLGLRRPAARRSRQALTHRACRGRPLGLGHRRLQLVRRRAPSGSTPRAARSAGSSSARCPASCARSARASRSRPTRGRRCGTRTRIADLAPLHEAPHAAVSLPRGGRRRVPARPGCRSCATLLLAHPRRPRARRARTSSCSAPTCWPRRCFEPGRAHARGLPAARALARLLARGALRRRATAPSLAAARGCCAAGAERVAAGAAGRAAAARARGRGAAAAARRRGHARAATARARRGAPGRPPRPDAAARLPARGAAAPGWARASGSCRSRAAGPGRSTCGASGRAGTGSRRRSPRCAARSAHAGDARRPPAAATRGATTGAGECCGPRSASARECWRSVRLAADEAAPSSHGACRARDGRGRGGGRPGIRCPSARRQEGAPRGILVVCPARSLRPGACPPGHGRVSHTGGEHAGAAQRASSRLRSPRRPGVSSAPGCGSARIRLLGDERNTLKFLNGKVINVE